MSLTLMYSQRELALLLLRPLYQNPARLVNFDFGRAGFFLAQICLRKLKKLPEKSRGAFYFAEYARNCADFVGATLLENLPRAGTGPRSGLDLGQRPSPLRAPVQSFALFFAHFSSSPQILLRFSELFLVPPHAAAQSQEDA